jgi:hypothetical protein
MVTPHFRGNFGQAKKNSSGNFENYLKVVYYFSESWSLKWPINLNAYKNAIIWSLIAQIGAKVVHFTKNAPHLKKFDIGEEKK